MIACVHSCTMDSRSTSCIVHVRAAAGNTLQQPLVLKVVAWELYWEHEGA